MIAAKQEWTTTLQTALGAFSMAFLLGLLSLGLWGVIGGLLWTLTGAIGLGAVLLTRFGTQQYVSTAQRQAAMTQGTGGEDLLDEPGIDDAKTPDDDPGEESTGE